MQGSKYSFFCFIQASYSEHSRQIWKILQIKIPNTRESSTAEAQKKKEKKNRQIKILLCYAVLFLIDCINDEK